MINPATNLFEIVKVLIFNIDEVIGRNGEYIDKSSARVKKSFNKKWLSRYPNPYKVLFDKKSEFKQEFLLFYRILILNLSAQQ